MALLILRDYGFVQCRRHLKVNAELHCDWLWRNFAVVTGHQQRVLLIALFGILAKFRSTA